MTKQHDEDSLDLGTKITHELTNAESFMEKNKKPLLAVLIGLVVIVGGFFGYKYLILEPQELEAQEALFIVERQFGMDSFNLVINGNGVDMSGVEIADNYGLTDAGNMASYMVGFSYLNLGNFDEAVTYLKDFSSDDVILGPLALGGLGDAYSELQDWDNAAKYYMKAAKHNKNTLSTPLFLKKAGLVYEKNEQYKDAVDCYTQIKEDYRTSEQFTEIDKYIARTKTKAGETE